VPGGAFLVAGVCATSAPLMAGTVPPAGLDWRVVNEVFAQAVRQQSIQNRGFLADSAFQPIYSGAVAPAPPPPAPAGVKVQNVASAATAEAAQQPQPLSGKWGWLSEIRLGILKHSAAISTNTPKEKGVDGNIEVLFTSPQWLDWMWSPRPHIGTSFNASSDDTDHPFTRRRINA